MEKAPAANAPATYKQAFLANRPVRLDNAEVPDSSVTGWSQPPDCPKLLLFKTSSKPMSCDASSRPTRSAISKSALKSSGTNLLVGDHDDDDDDVSVALMAYRENVRGGRMNGVVKADAVFVATKEFGAMGTKLAPTKGILDQNGIIIGISK